MIAYFRFIYRVKPPRKGAMLLYETGERKTCVKVLISGRVEKAA